MFYITGSAVVRLPLIVGYYANELKNHEFVPVGDFNFLQRL